MFSQTVCTGNQRYLSQVTYNTSSHMLVLPLRAVLLLSPSKHVGGKTKYQLYQEAKKKNLSILAGCCKQRAKSAVFMEIYNFLVN